MTLDIVPAQDSDAGWIADLIGTEFLHLAVVRWLVPDPADRARILAGNFRIHIEYALTHGTVEIPADRSGAAVWLPRDGADLPPPPDYDRRLVQACGPAAERFRHLDELFEQNHPGDAHHHLAFLAVRTARQRQGVGTALVEHYHRRLDQAGLAAFLEASSTGSRDLYARLGYRPHGETYRAPNGALFWPMWRPPRGLQSRPDAGSVSSERGAVSDGR